MSLSAEPNEEALIDQMRKGDVNAFTSLIRAYESPARGVAFSIVKSQVEMEDVLQEAYLKAYRSIASFREGANFRAWLCRIVLNTAIDMVRKRKVMSWIPFDVDQSFQTSVDDAVERRLEVRKALAELSEVQRTAILLIDGEQFSYAEVASVMRIPQGTVATRVHTARQILRKILSTPKGEK